ncbi:retroelement silencing factor 1 isoform X1 [Lemur catta]|uniref:retroelement silencing factor 1 isoform X1 n=1 Tax=Lemur catta TaxID=9447 RepID=UPI001E26D610|nr:retroelement silencing factor 1 isoform X1 [Lemur catta]XP_045410011.1 retroelement silencing factor 1 isoform X1 [Lemur catta]XP_045410012.1 retroelement silencing factor 1 isoform X1 [Lemur catta]XP_045410013.1 retroelement silencing factor 1 isoform X1 [Lemur catta]
MNWNAEPESATLPPQYPKSQSSFLQQSLINQFTTASHSSFGCPGNNQEACMYPNNSNPVPQALRNVQNYPQQLPVSDINNGTVVASQTLLERITFGNVKGPKQLSHNLQMSSGVTQNVWLNSTMRNPVVSHTGATVSHQADFAANIPNIHAPQSQLVTSDTYSTQPQMIPSNSLRVPVTYQGNQGLNHSFSERKVDWAQQYASNGLTYPDYRPLPKQYYYAPQKLLQDPNIQKRNPMPSTSLQVKNSQLPSSVLTLQSKEIAAVPSQQYATQLDIRLPPPPPPYDCRYRSQPLQTAQHVLKHVSVEVPQSQETRMDSYRGFQQQWQNPNESVSTIGNFCNVKVNASVKQPFNEPIRFSVDAVQALAQNNQEKRMDSCHPTSNQVLDTSFTKEKLVRDIKTLVEIKKKFSELARKIKINKNLLMAAGCIKMTDNSYSQPAQNSELSLKEQTAKIQSGLQITPVTPEIAEGQLSTIAAATETSKTHCALNSSVQEINCRKFNQVSSVVLDSVCSEKLPMSGQCHDWKVPTSSKTSTVEMTQATLNDPQLSSENSVQVELNLPTICETISVPQSASFEEYASKLLNKNKLLLNLLTQGDNIENKLLKDASQTTQDSKVDSCEMNLSTQVTGNQLILKTTETSSTANVNARISDNFNCIKPESSTKGMPAKSDSNYSMELLATCLSLWKKKNLETTEEKQCNESRTNRTAVGISKPTDVCVKSVCSVVGNSQNKIVNPSEETALSMVVQNYESSGTTITKGTELQIAVVSPLILSDVKTLSVKGITPEALPETVYPVIKEGSVCSLQNQLAENMTVSAALKVGVNGSVASTTSTKISPLTQKEKESESTNGNSEGTSNIDQGKYNKSESEVHSLVSDKPTLYKSEDNTIVSSDIIQIDNICSLVEGDVSYNSQIAKIFNSVPMKKVEPQKPLPNQEGISNGQQKEQIGNITENKDFDFQKDKLVQCTDVSHKITDLSKSGQPPESSSFNNAEANRSALEESNRAHTMEKESTANSMCSSAAGQQDIYSQEVDVSSNYTAQEPSRNEIDNDKTSALYLHDQLSELLREFPYGIEAINRHEGSVGQQMTSQISEDQTGDKSSCDSKDSTDQIQITILSSEQMKELFPEQDDQPCDVDKLAEPQKEKPTTEAGGQSDPQALTKGENRDSPIVDSEKDDVHCCALGWLSMVYEGVPQCQCNSITNSTSKEEKGKAQCSPLKTNSDKQGERTSARDVPIVEFYSPSNNPKTSLSLTDEKNHFSEIQSNTIKDTSKTQHNSLLRMEQELTGPFSSKCDKLVSLQNHEKKPLRFHEVTFHSSNKTAFSEQSSQESLQKKHVTQNLRPLKAKTVLSINKDLYKKHNSSSVQLVSPEKKKSKFKAGGFKQKHLEKRKLDQGSTLDMEVKKKKHDKQEQNKTVGGTLKLRDFLSNPNERASVKEKTVSNTKSSDPKASSTVSNPKSSDPKASSSKGSRVITVKEYLQRQKHKEAVSNEASKRTHVKNVPCNSEHPRPGKLSVQVGSCEKSNERHSISVQTSKESLNIFTSHGKNLKVHHSEESKTCNVSRNVKGAVGGKQPDKMWIDKAKLGKKLTNINNEVQFGQMPPQAKEQRKSYLNRVAFKCTERESICLTKLDNSPKKLNKNKEKTQENKPKTLLPVKDTTEKPGMLQFKLCPDVLLKNANSVEDKKDLKPRSRKEQAPVQVSGIKSTKEDWLKCVTVKKRMLEDTEEIDNNVNSRPSKRSFSVDGFEMLQNPVKDSKAMFQTYKQMYLEKRSRSLGSSPIK